jgi:hypothetical protein
MHSSTWRGFAVLAFAGFIACSGSSYAKDFTFNETTNAQMARRLGIPVFFAVPSSAHAAIPGNFDTSDRLIEFKHPAARKTTGHGLRLIVSKRAGLSPRLAKTGLIQTGDVLLTFRPEWGGAGAYSNLQMGISHTALAYVQDGKVRHLDVPMTEEYLGRQLRGELTSEHYQTLKFIHVVRPRGLSDVQRANIAAWAGRVRTMAHRIYPNRLRFNPDYNAPKYRRGVPNTFLTQFAQILLGRQPTGALDMFCSEFVWALLSLRDCDLSLAAAAFRGGENPTCVREPMRPMAATGDYVLHHDPRSNSGLADGPLMVIDALNLPPQDREALLRSVFVEASGALAKLSSGHRAVALAMKPKFAPLAQYYLAVGSRQGEDPQMEQMRQAIHREIPENYSPASFLINTLLPPDNAHRAMDYVATIVIE